MLPTVTPLRRPDRGRTIDSLSTGRSGTLLDFAHEDCRFWGFVLATNDDVFQGDYANCG